MREQQLLDRYTPPAAGPLKKVSLPPYEQTALDNGLPVYLLPYGTAEVVQLQMVYRAGTGYQPRAGLASYTARMMQEGTRRHSSLEIAQKLDEYGAWLGNDTTEQALAMTLTTLSSHLEKVLPLFQEVLESPAFPEREFDLMKARNLQKLQVQEMKTSFQARRYFGHYLFGKNHPYGMHLGREELMTLDLPQIIQYYQQYVHAGNAALLVVGNFEEAPLMQQLNQLFGQQPMPDTPAPVSQVLRAGLVSQNGRRYHQLPGMQATLRLGHLGFRREHPDYYPMQVVNTILGGYFGSRLMKNIREEKGYTYGIYSAWVSLKYHGFLVVQTDVGNEYIEATISEVKKEMQALRQQPVPPDELELVKNYLLGKSISQRETPFQMAEILRASVMNGISFEEMDRKFEIFQQISAEDILALSQKYLQPDSLLEVVVGEMK